MGCRYSEGRLLWFFPHSGAVWNSTCQCPGRGCTCGRVAGCMWPAFHPNSDHPSSVCTESLLPASLRHSILCFRTGRKEEVPTACFQTGNCTVACSIAVACLFSTIKPLVF